jgi:hypothetical protein
MLRTAVEGDLLDDHLDDGYLSPAYPDYCFANVNPTALSLLGADVDRTLPADVFDGVLADAGRDGGTDLDAVGADVDHVVVLFLDGYGYEHWKRDHGDVPLLSALTERGTVTPLTSIYPSETTAATTTFHTGRTPVEHGLLGWWQYVERVDDVIQPLPFTTVDGEPVGEAYPDLEYADLYAGESLYERAAAEGVETHLHQPFPASGPEIGATRTTEYRNVADLAVRLRLALESDGADYRYGYVPTVDAAAHAAGTESDEYRAQLEAVCAALRRELVGRLDGGVADRTLFVLTADHGMVDTVPGENVQIRREDLPEVWDHLRRDGEGEPIPPVGSPRNLHLHLRDGTVEEVRETIESRYPCRTHTREEAFDTGLFGDREPSELFRRRCGDLVVVHRDRGMWWERSEWELVGMHGGLTREEMLVPFAAARLSDLQD